MLDWINGLTSEATSTLKGLVTFIAAVAFVISSAKGGWAVARIITSALVAGIVIVIVWNMDTFAKKFEPELKSASVIGVPMVPSTSHTLHI
jgi:hypothetical protein